MITETAFSTAGGCGKAPVAGVDEHIGKPISPQRFVAQIEAFLPEPLRSSAGVHQA